MERFPTNNDEFRELLLSLRIDPGCWIEEKFNKQRVLECLYLRGIWDLTHEVPPRLFSRECVERNRARTAENPKREIPDFIPIVERMLDAGVSSEDISALLTIFREELAFSIMYFLGDPGNTFPDTIADSMRFALYSEDDRDLPIPESKWDWTCVYERWSEAAPQ